MLTVGRANSAHFSNINKATKQKYSNKTLPKEMMTKVYAGKVKSFLLRYPPKKI